MTIDAILNVIFSNADMIFSIVSLIISLCSLVVSCAKASDKSFAVRHVPKKDLNDPFDLLFDNNNKIPLDLANFNNRDMLIHLCDGYVCINEDKYKVKEMYYTLKKNSITTIEVEILLSEAYSGRTKKAKINLVFKYKGLIFNRAIKIRST